MGVMGAGPYSEDGKEDGSYAIINKSLQIDMSSEAESSLPTRDW